MILTQEISTAQAAPVTNDLAVLSTHQMTSTNRAGLRTIWTHAVQTETTAIGWLPTSVFDTRADRGEVVAVYRNNDLVGWCMHAKSTARAVLKLYQIWVRPDARILEHGRALVDQLRRVAVAQNCWAIEAWVAEDLPANFFWTAIGFLRHNWRYGRGNQPRKHFRWTSPILAAKCNTQKIIV